VYLDNVKLLLVAVIIAGHGALAYSTLESAWPYQDIQETRLGAAPDLVLLMAVIPAALFAMGLFFLISGLVTPGSLSRKGPRTFARDRLVRLGVPLALWTLRRGCGFAAVGGVAAFFALFGIVAARGVDEDVVYDTGVHWAPAVLALIEGPIAVGASVWLLGLAQQHLDRRPGPFLQAMARSAYAAFVVQGVVLIALMVAMRPVAVPAEVKALTVAGLGLAGSFALAWLLVTRTRLGRVL
jgi:acyltransferase-like protein